MIIYSKKLIKYPASEFLKKTLDKLLIRQIMLKCIVQFNYLIILGKITGQLLPIRPFEPIIMIRFLTIGPFSTSLMKLTFSWAYSNCLPNSYRIA